VWQGNVRKRLMTEVAVAISFPPGKERERLLRRLRLGKDWKVKATRATKATVIGWLTARIEMEQEKKEATA
jgi:hypothetical protein